jgi:hypothetical protein
VLYNKFVATLPNNQNISKNTFRKYQKLARIYKKPHRLTDICDYCFWGKKTQESITKFLKGENFVFDASDFESEKIFGFCETKLKELQSLIEDENSSLRLIQEASRKILNFESIIDQLSNLKAIFHHREIAFIQRNEYNKQRKDVSLLRNSILIEADFKQKILIGMSPDQLNSQFYHQQRRTLLGNLLVFRISF